MASPRQNRTPALRSSFTEAQRDRQARGKDPYTRGESPSEEEKMRLGAGPVTESFAEREKRHFAMEVLSSPDLLMMHALSEGDSLARQRLRFTAIMCGYPDPTRDADTGGPSLAASSSAAAAAARRARRSAAGAADDGEPSRQ